MKINQYSQNPNFKAIKIAQTQNCVRENITNIDIFKLTKEDNSFLEKLKETSIKKLCPNLKEDIQERWQKVLNYCLEVSKRIYNTTYVAVSENNVCGIMVIDKDYRKHVILDGICAIPNKNGEKTNLAGQTLLYQLFKSSSKEDKGIQLDAIHNGPVDVVKKYKNLGFIINSETANYTEMSCNKHKVREQLNNFEKQINYTPIQEEHVNLEQLIN